MESSANEIVSDAQPCRGQLRAFVEKHGPRLDLRGKVLTVEAISGDGDLQVGTFRATRATYTGVLCTKARVAGHPGSEVWAVLSASRTIASFAVHDGRLLVVG